MKKIFIIINLLIFSTISYSQFPAINWKYDFKDNAFGQSAAADLDGDGLLEIVFSTYRNDGFLHVLNAEDGSLLWKKDLGGCGDVAPLIYDVDGDNQLDIIVPGSCNPKTFCFNGKTGEIKWTAKTRGSDSPPTIADLNKDGKMEILHGEFTGYVICLDAETGNVNWEIQVTDNSWIQTAPTICNINNDGFPDFVVANWSFGELVSIYGYNGLTHQLIWENDYPTGNFYHGTAVADLDNDGKEELVLGCYDGYLYVLNAEDGSISWKYTDKQFYTGSPVVIADLDKKGSYEIIFSNYFYITALKSNGELFWKYSMKDYGQSFRGVALSDIDGDEYLDVVFGDTYGILYALNGSNGKEIWKLNLTNDYGDTLDIDHAPLIADFNKDGKNDVFIIGGKANYPDVSTNYGRGYMISAGFGKGPNWLMFQANERRDGLLNSLKTDVKESIYNQNNQLVDNKFIINDLMIEKADKIHLFDILGNEIATDLDIIINENYSTIYFNSLNYNGLLIIRITKDSKIRNYLIMKD